MTQTSNPTFRPHNALDLLLVDGLNLVFACYEAKGFKLSHQGQETTIIVGVPAMLRKLIGRYRPKGVVVVWEGRGGKWRRKRLFPPYKEKRTDYTKEELNSIFSQTRKVEDLIYYLGLMEVRVDSYEADDVLYSLATFAGKEKDLGVVVSTSDRDLLQVVAPNIMWYSPMEGKEITYRTFEETVGVPPSKYVDYKCLVVDRSDNLPGIKGIGPKTAKEILEKSGSLDGHLVRGQPLCFRDKVLFTDAGQEDLALMRRLVDLEIFNSSTLLEEIFNNLEKGKVDEEEVRLIFEEAGAEELLSEFSSYLQRFQGLENEEVLMDLGC